MVSVASTPAAIPVTRVSDMSGGRGDLIKNKLLCPFRRFDCGNRNAAAAQRWRRGQVSMLQLKLKLKVKLNLKLKVKVKV